MNYSKNEIYKKLYQIFMKYKKRHKSPPKATDMACMWSTINPPDIIEGTSPFLDIEKAFDIYIDDNDCMELYDMDLEEAVEKIADMIKEQC